MAKGKTTLNEIMGKQGDQFAKSGIDFSDLPALLGDGMPELKFTALGRVRLMRALQQRFGSGYRNVPGIAKLMKRFDEEAKTELEHHKLKQKLGRK